MLPARPRPRSEKILEKNSPGLSCEGEETAQAYENAVNGN
jgi:hypothetical protein